MDDPQQLRRLKRAELLEVIVQQQKEIERLNKELEAMRYNMYAREMRMQKVGSLAEASLAVTNIFEEAQRAADTYLFNIQQLYGRQV
ncbi:MAG: hypothetical protein IKE43_03015 [Coriobacteriales bacterium]|nr:hypothetical protein [Coriobacteriales bacterium]